MTLYDADIGKQSMERMRELFSQSPYQILDGNRQRVLRTDGDARTEIFAYSKDDIAVFFGTIATLSEDAKDDLVNKLEQVETLRKVAGKVRSAVKTL